MNRKRHFDDGETGRWNQVIVFDLQQAQCDSFGILLLLNDVGYLANFRWHFHTQLSEAVRTHAVILSLQRSAAD